MNILIIVSLFDAKVSVKRRKITMDTLDDKLKKLYEMMWTWQNLKKDTESVLITAQNKD